MGRTAHIISGEGKPMHTATKRTLIAGAGLAAAALFGSLPYQGSTQAAGVPIQHHDVALVDVTETTLLFDEGTFDNAFWNDVLGPTGAEADLYNALGANAAALLDTDGAVPAFSGAFNGAESRLFEALFVDTLATEDQINQALGVSATDSQAALLNIFNTDFVPLPTGVAEPVVGANFDADLLAVANGDYSAALSDLTGYAEYLATNFATLGSGLDTLLVDFGASFSDLSNLNADFTTLITDVTALLGGGLL
jgi:hypothetical protein